MTEYLLLNIFLFAVGLVILVKGSDWFIDGAAYLAKRMNIPDAIVGLTLVSIGTSLPELASNIYAASSGTPEVAMGVIPGSNIANILLVLGITVFLMKRVDVSKLLFARDSMVLALSFAVFAVMCYFFPISNGKPGLNRIEAGILLVMFFGYMYMLLSRKGKFEEDVKHEAEEHEKTFADTITKALICLIGGGVLVGLGSQLMVDNVVWIAQEKLGISPELVAATIIAIGTSVPELAVTFAGIMKKKSDIALGNIVGSSIFNLIFVMGITGMVAEIPVKADAAELIIPYMLGSGVMLIIFMRTGWFLARWEGFVMLLAFLSYIAINVYKVLS